MVAVLGGSGAAPPEPGLQLAPAVGPGHPVAALLAGETPHRIPAPDVLRTDNGGEDEQNEDGQARERDRGDDAICQTAQNLRCGGRPCAGGR